MSRNPVAPEPKDQWSGRVGFMLATIGSAIGIGSVWKLPYEVGENGGATFILFYVLGLLLVVLPLMLAEFVIGRRGGGDTVPVLRAACSAQLRLGALALGRLAHDLSRLRHPFLLFRDRKHDDCLWRHRDGPGIRRIGCRRSGRPVRLFRRGAP